MYRGKKFVKCPKCGFRFDVSYGRVFACGECPSVIHCDMMKCPKCGDEFPLDAQEPVGITQFADQEFLR